jgi:hypothetical protein
LYPLEFKTITPQYTSSWFNFSDAQGRAQGFASAYAMSGPDDDFVETVSIMLIEGKNRWEEIVTALPAATQALLRKKEAIVVDYYKKIWNIDFYNLQKRTQDALNRLSPDPVSKYFGFGKQYTRVSVNPANALLTQGSAFTTAFNSAKTGLAAFNTTANYILDSMAVIMTGTTTATQRLYFHNGSGTPVTNFQADYNYTVTTNANGSLSFTFVNSNANGTAIATAVAALTDVIKNNAFSVDWFLSPNNTVRPLRLKFTSLQNANLYFMGLVLP